MGPMMQQGGAHLVLSGSALKQAQRAAVAMEIAKAFIMGPNLREIFADGEAAVGYFNFAGEVVKLADALIEKLERRPDPK